MSNSAKIWGVAGLAIVAGILLIVAVAKGPDAIIPSGSVSLAADDWTLGSVDSKVVLMEYSDFACPACKSASSVVNQLVGEFGEHMVFVYRHFPLNIPGHQNGPLAARAAEAAGLQGKFFDMSDKLFMYQDIWKSAGNPEANFEQYATDLGLDLEKFKTDYASSAVESAVDDDLDSANDLNLNSTPTFFLNGEKLSPNPKSYDDFRNLIRNAIENAKNS